MFKIDEAIDYCEQAKQLVDPPYPRSLLLLALAKSFKARQTSIHTDRQSFFQSSVNELREYEQLLSFFIFLNILLKMY